MYLHAHNPLCKIGTINTTFYTLQTSNIWMKLKRTKLLETINIIICKYEISKSYKIRTQYANLGAKGHLCQRAKYLNSHDHSNPNYHKVKYYPNLQHLQNQPLFQFHQFFTLFSVAMLATPPSSTVALFSTCTYYACACCSTCELQQGPRLGQGVCQRAWRGPRGGSPSRGGATPHGIGECSVRVEEHVDQW